MEGDSDSEELPDKSFTKILPVIINGSKWEDRAIFSSQFLHESSSMCSMVSIKDSQDSSHVFPPINHENLRIPSSVLYPPSASSSSLSTLSVENDVESSDSTFTSYSSSSSEFVAELTRERRFSSLRGISQWINLGFGVFYSKIKVGFFSFQSSSTARSPAVVAVMMGFLYIGIRRLLRRRNESRNHLHRVIREKEEDAGPCKPESSPCRYRMRGLISQRVHLVASKTLLLNSI